MLFFCFEDAGIAKTDYFVGEEEWIARPDKRAEREQALLCKILV